MSGPVQPSSDDALDARVAAARPRGDAVLRAVHLAQVSEALFGEGPPPVQVGRYQLLRELGRGGGGSVFLANDPELRREVAIKLIACPSGAQRARALVEARTLARLAHPHVVPMYDVGETDTHVFLVMERVEGASLREFASAPRTVRELVKVWREAALGLAAAHAEGLVHRDVKPDNALLGADGRVRVVDFGLASSVQAGVVDGTPGYMAPEQRSGNLVGPGADQYALGVSLREALVGRRTPRWLQRTLARSTAENPEQRFPSMQALAQALAEDPLRKWQRRALVAASAVLAAAAFWLGRGAEARACSGAEAALAEVWSPSQADGVEAHLDALGTPLAKALRSEVGPRLRALGEAWRQTHRSTCLMHQRSALSADGFAWANACLLRARASLKAATVLLEQSDAASLDTAAQALAVVEPPTRCAEPQQALGQGAPPSAEAQAVAQAHEVALVHARASTPQAVSLAQAAVDAARPLGPGRLLARTLVTLGQAQLQGDLTLAVKSLGEAWRLALAHGSDDLAVEAWARQAWALGRSPGTAPLEGLGGFDVVAALAERTGDQAAFARALLFMNAGSLAITSGDFARARSDYRNAEVLSRSVTGPEAVELVNALTGLAAVSEGRAERRRLFALAVSRLQQLVGPEHALTLTKQLNATADSEEPTEVIAGLKVLCPRLTALHPSLKAPRERCGRELAWQAFALGDGEALRVAGQLFSLPPLEGVAADARGLVAVLLALAEGRDVRAALAPLRASPEATLSPSAPAGWYQHADSAEVQLVLAVAAQATGDQTAAHRAAVAALEHLKTALVRVGVPSGALLRRLSWTNAVVAQTR